MNAFTISWVPRSLDGPKEPSNPNFPEGIVMDLSNGAADICTVDLPYPAPGVGCHVMICRICHTRVMASAANRPDDPKRLTIACKSVLRA